MQQSTEEAITGSTINDEVCDRLRRWITSGTLLPGARISLRSIADTFGVSTTPVREALRKLQSEGLVVFERRSVTVTNLSREQVHEVFQIRLRLEQLASEWAIDQVGVDDMADLEDILSRMEQPGLQAQAWRDLNQDFHRRFYDCARSPHLLELIRNMWNKIEPYMAIYASTVEDFNEAHRQHQRILQHIRARNLSALLVELADHINYTEQTVVVALNQESPNA